MTTLRVQFDPGRSSLTLSLRARTKQERWT
jgi:hypothetical protein